MLLLAAKRPRLSGRRENYVKDDLENHSKGQQYLFGIIVECHPISPKDQGRIHQFGKKLLPGIFLGCELVAERMWKRDILIADVEDLEKLDASNIYLRRIEAKEVLRVKKMTNSYSRGRWYSKIVRKGLQIPRTHSEAGTDRKELPREGSETQPSDFSVEERHLLSVAYGSIASDRRAAWRIIVSDEQKEKFKGMEQQASHAREHVAKVEGEIQRIRYGIPALMDENLILSSSTGESKEKGLINRLQADAPSEVNHVFHHDEGTSKAFEKKEDLEADITKHTFKLETAVSEGHPYEICDQTSDVVIDACLVCDGKYRIACETCVKDNTVMVEREYLAVSLASEIIVMLVIQTQEKTQLKRSSWTTIKILVVAQRQIPIDQTLQQTIETPQLQCIDEMIDVFVVLVVQVPGARVVKKTVDNPQFKIAEKTVQNPETQTTQSSDIQVSQVHVVMKTVETPLVQTVVETIEIPQLSLVKKIGVIPESIETPCIQGP